ncbi:MAG: monovalent cation/H+ antiporter complex subunit F [Microlunatus sp.]|nr:monovalent cation/H+ antiporter complex subunit F [Microlunatus sp.]MDN5771719.1 monovalent cation/H+ antiporter complex subunit F [Microlunatus sp.]MDN5805148.1 monovalent cation/H+ antiporter complex subunit F [Microlunatus sp.]
MIAQQVIIMIGVAFLVGAVVMTLIRLARGPSTLDRVVAADVIIAVLIVALAMEAAINHHATSIPIILVLSLLGFAGSLSMARFVADRDQARKWDVSTSAPRRSERSPEGT